VLAVGLILSPPRSRWLEGALVVVIAVAASVLTALLLGRYFLDRMEDVIAVRMGDATRAALTSASGMGKFLTQEELSIFERALDVETIWIIGKDFASEITPPSPFLDVVKHNLQRGITYVYIAPDDPNDPLPSHQLDMLRAAVDAEDHKGLLRTELLSLADWQRLPYTEGNVTIYDPNTTGKSPTGYFWYPGGDGKSFGGLGREVVVKWVARIVQLCPGLITDARHVGPPGEKEED
jgi:hypothetical protein